ncbi:MAG TPA: hypothetical protein VHC43_05210 [Mycobacteriales bacterium]|nr:hypothetical protein [Mycobacteriales bacterium]
MKRPTPLATTLLWCGLLICGGIASISVGYAMVARTLDVFDQVPALVSGGIGGIALVITGCVLGYVQIGRACTERERGADDHVLDRIGALAEIERRRIAAQDARPPKQRTGRAPAKRASA